MITGHLEKLILEGKARTRILVVPDHNCTISIPDGVYWVLHHISGYAQLDDNFRQENPRMVSELPIASLQSDNAYMNVPMQMVRRVTSSDSTGSVVITYANAKCDVDTYFLVRGETMIWAFGTVDDAPEEAEVDNVGAWNGRIRTPYIVNVADTMNLYFAAEDPADGRLIGTDRIRVSDLGKYSYQPQITRDYGISELVLGLFYLQIVEVDEELPENL